MLVLLAWLGSVGKGYGKVRDGSKLTVNTRALVKEVVTKVLVFLTFAVFLVFFTYVSVFAVPLLQLDIEDGYYVGLTEETIFAPGPSFNLYALLNTVSGNYVKEMETGDFYISAALVQVTADADPPSGSFSFNGTMVNVPGDMTLHGGPLGLPTHGIFPTDWIEFSFQFDSEFNAELYNSQDSPGGLNISSEGPLLYAVFPVDTSGLDPAYTIHFDLYDKTSPEVGNFAPFSHDAQSFPIPEPATMLLLGAGLIGLAGLGRKKFFKKA